VDETMPIYEYRCRNCGRRSSFLFLDPEHPPELRCRHCKGTDLVRIMSRFGWMRGEEAILESMADPSKLGDIDENDPASVARWMKRFGKEFGEELGEDFEEAMDEAMAEAESERGGGESTGEQL